MLKVFSIIQSEYPNIKNIKMKIKSMLDKGDLISIKKGIYETDKSINPFYLANVIYNPSYISFQTALSFYGLIPERTYNVTNATYGKNKTKEYDNYFGKYIYRDVPKSVFPYGTKSKQFDGYMYTIASKEKALLDMLYNTKPLYALKNLNEYLSNDLRFKMDELINFDLEFINEISPLYHSTNVTLFTKFINNWRENNDQ